MGVIGNSVPLRMQCQPLHQGVHVPWLALWDDGVPCYSLADEDRRVMALLNHLCGQCGQALEPVVAFIAESDDVMYRIFRQPACHEDCARYALDHRDLAIRLTLYFADDYKAVVIDNAVSAYAAPAINIEVF